MRINGTSVPHYNKSDFTIMVFGLTCGAGLYKCALTNRLNVVQMSSEKIPCHFISSYLLANSLVS